MANFKLKGVHPYNFQCEGKVYHLAPGQVVELPETAAYIKTILAKGIIEAVPDMDPAPVQAPAAEAAAQAPASAAETAPKAAASKANAPAAAAAAAAADADPKNKEVSQS